MYDKDTLSKDDLLGTATVDLSSLPMGKAVNTSVDLITAGKLMLELHATDFGLTAMQVGRGPGVGWFDAIGYTAWVWGVGHKGRCIVCGNRNIGVLVFTTIIRGFQQD